MPDDKKKHPSAKTQLHPRNAHRGRYDFDLLIASCPELEKFVALNTYGDRSIDFFNPEAVKSLNKALLMHHYALQDWDIPQNYLCPPIPGRADYIHHIATLLGSRNADKIPRGAAIKCLDIGVGANGVYPIIGTHEYGWSFVGTDIDPDAIAAAHTIIEANPRRLANVSCRLQPNPSATFDGILAKNERFDLSICNPPFHASMAESKAGTLRKLSNLKNKKITKARLNFGGKSNELWTPGGEKRFILNMIKQSVQVATSCFCFSTLVSKASNLDAIYHALDKIGVEVYKTIPMGQGNKKSRIVAWSFLTEAEEKAWIKQRWEM